MFALAGMVFSLRDTTSMQPTSPGSLASDRKRWPGRRLCSSGPAGTGQGPRGCFLTEQSRRRFLSRTRAAASAGLRWGGREGFISSLGVGGSGAQTASPTELSSGPAQPSRRLPRAPNKRWKAAGGGEVAVCSRNWFLLLQLGELQRSAVHRGGLEQAWPGLGVLWERLAPSCGMWALRTPDSVPSPP